ncbi:MAG: hypothetical protein V3T05_14070, partial [Myxococcota bacterium]
MRIKLPPGEDARLGPLAPVNGVETDVVLELRVVDGKIDFSGTSVGVETLDPATGKPKETVLTAGGWFSTYGARINPRTRAIELLTYGTIETVGGKRVHKKTYLDVTRRILGVDRVPERFGELVRLLRAKHGGSSEKANAHSDPLPLASVTISGSGKLKPGPLPLGNDMFIDVGPDNAIRIEGPLSDWRLHADIPVRSLRLGQGRNRLASGAGTIELDVHYQGPTTQPDRAQSEASITILRLDLPQITELTLGDHRLSGSISTAGDDSGQPVIRILDGGRDFVVNMPHAELDLSGSLALWPADGPASRVTIKRGSFAGSLRLDTRKAGAGLEITGDHVEVDLASSVVPLPAAQLGLAAAAGRLRSTGSFSYHYTDGVRIAEAHLEASLERLTIGGSDPQSAVVTIAPSSVTLTVKDLVIPPGGTPRFARVDGTAEIHVETAQLPSASGRARVLEDLTGKLTTTMVWDEGQRAPQVQLAVELALGSRLDLGDLTSIEGLAVDNGNWAINADITLLPDGRLETRAGIEFDGLLVMQSQPDGAAALAPPRLRSKPVVSQRSALAQPRRQRPAATSADSTEARLTPIEVPDVTREHIAELVRGITRLRARMSIPEFDELHVDPESLAVSSAIIDAAPDAAVAVTLEVEGGAVDTARSRIEFVDGRGQPQAVDIEVDFAGPWVPPTRFRLAGFRVTKDPSGRGTLRPIFLDASGAETTRT